MKKRKTIIAAIVLLLVFVVGGAIAYFTDTDSATNKFTIGNVDIDVVETAWDALPDADSDGIPNDAEDMMPGETITKDPKITNTSTTNPAYVFMKVESPCTTGTTPVELFNYTTDPGINTGWELMTNGTCTNGKITRIYSYSTSGTMEPLTAGSSTPTLFVGNTLTLNTAVTGDLPTDTNIVVTGYGIQSEGLASATNTAVWANFS